MRGYYEHFRIDDMPILATDQDLDFSKQDLDAEGSGRDELGYMHRIILRERVGQWNLKYAKLTEDEFEYMESLFRGKPSFKLEVRNGTKRIQIRGYCSNVRAAIHDAERGVYKNISYTVTEV